jgi:hypothetical protein
MRPTALERRALPRQRVFKGGVITSKRVNFRAACTIRNLTEHGACLKLPEAAFAPLEFELTFSDGTVEACRIIWRDATNRLGIAFQQSIGAAHAKGL